MLNIFKEILFSVNALFITLIGVKLLDFLFNLTHFILKIRKEKQTIQSLSNSKISIKDISNLTPLEFEMFSAIFLDYIGFKDIYHVPTVDNCGDGGKDIICFKDKVKYYVECKRYSHRADAQFVINLNIVRKLIGTMIGDGVAKGIIITTGHITVEALEYAQNLPSHLSIEFFGAQDLLEIFMDETTIDTIPEQA